MKIRLSSRGGFTLIELMIVLGIILILMGFGVPAFVRTMKKNDMQEAVDAVMEGLKLARATAIMQGTAAEFVLKGDGTVSVERVSGPATGLGQFHGASGPAPSGYTAQLPESVGPELLEVNFQDHMTADAARVRFFPNGTSDEFTMVLRSAEGERRLIRLEIVTGLAALETDPARFLQK
jgi:prepilin-type N-terminal cleavage/methylation domain-containing protein